MSLRDAHRFMRLAVEDRQAVASRAALIADRIVCYDAQQAAEKAVKAVILFDELLEERDRQFRDHDIERLLLIIENGGRRIPATVAAAVVLTPCASDVRYGLAMPPVPRKELLGLVDPVLRWASRIVGVR